MLVGVNLLEEMIISIGAGSTVVKSMVTLSDKSQLEKRLN